MLRLFKQNQPTFSLIKPPVKRGRLIDVLCATSDNQREAKGIHEHTIMYMELGSEKLPTPLARMAKTVLHTLEHYNILSFLTDARQSQLITLNEEADAHELTAPEKKANFLTNIALAATGFAGIGLLFYPPLRLLSVPILVYRLSLAGEVAYAKFKAGQGMFNVELIEFITLTTIISQGYLLVVALDNVLFGIAEILIEKVKHESRSDMLDVFRQQPQAVWVMVDGTEIETPIEMVQMGDTVVVHAGETIPIDGVIVKGTASIDQHILTGESQLAEKGVGDEVFALTLLRTGTIQIRVEKTGEATAAAQISQILTDTVDFKTGRLLQAEKVADQSVAPLFALGTLTLPFIGFRSSMAVIDSHYKRKPSIASAISILNFFKQAAAQGILIKDGRTLELLTEIDTVVFDKTGTLTEGEPHVGAVYSCNGYTENDVLTLAAAAEHKQSHPIAKAIRQAAAERALPIPPLTDVDYKVGYGLTVLIEGREVCVGSLRFMELMGVALPSSLSPIQQRSHEQGHSLVFVAQENKMAGALELRATVRPGAKSTIEALRKRKISNIYIISGDHDAPTRYLAEELGVDDYFSEVLPKDKGYLIETLQQEGKSVCFVGDGINDSIALKTANVSVSLRGASTLAVDTAHVILMDQSLNQLDTLFEIAHGLDTNTKQILGAVLAPAAICLGGALFFGFTQITSILLNLVSLGFGVTTAMLPMRKNKMLQDTTNRDFNTQVTFDPDVEH